MCIRSRRSILVLSLIVVTIAGALAPAEAHLWRDYYTNGGYTARWDVQQISWYFDQAYASQGLPFQDRARNATATWNNVPNGYVWLNHRGGVNWNAYERCSSNGGTSILRWGELTGSAAVTWYCFRPQPNNGEWNITGFSITIDSSPHFPEGGAATWYPHTATGAGNQVDLWSALTHEFGHAIGQAVHFSETDLCPTEASADHSRAPTMCAGVWYGNDTNRRTIEDHDVHTMQGAYANPPSPPSTTTTTRSNGGVGVGSGGCDSYNGTLTAIGTVYREVRCV